MAVKPQYGAWYAIAGVVGALAIWHAVYLVRSWLIVRRGDRQPTSLSTASSSGKCQTTEGHRRRNLSGSLFTLYQSTCRLSSLRLPAAFSRGRFGWAWEMSSNELFLTAAYTGVFIGLGFYGHTPATYANIKGWANQMGVIAYAQIPIIVALAGKNNVVSWLTGVGYERLNVFHRMSARVCIVCSWVHVAAKLASTTGAAEIAAEAYLQYGLVAIVAFTLILGMSLRPWRSSLYELFLISHVLLVIALIVGLWYHRTEFNPWIKASVAIWAFDRGLRLLRWIALNIKIVIPSSSRRQLVDTRVELLTDGVMRVTMRRGVFKWRAGQHAYMMMPSLSSTPLETHPFTMLGTPEPQANAVEANVGLGQDHAGEVTFLIKARDGFTRRLRDKAVRYHSDSEKQIVAHLCVSAYLEGPYGSTRSLAHFDTVVLAAGGSGITFAMSHLCGILDDVERGRGVIKRVRLVWMMRDPDSFAWIEPTLRRRLARLPFSTLLSDATPHGLDLQVEICVTQMSEGGIWGDVAARAMASRTGAHGDGPEETSDDAVRRRDSGATLVAAAAMTTSSTLKAVPAAGIDLSPTPSSLSSEERLPAPIAAKLLRRPTLAAMMSRRSSRFVTSTSVPQRGQDEQDEHMTDVIPLPAESTPTIVIPNDGSRPIEIEDVVYWRKGRADLAILLSSLASTASGPVSVNVCGPLALQDSARRAVKQAAKVGEVWKGEKVPVSYYAETFGW